MRRWVTAFRPLLALFVAVIVAMLWTTGAARASSLVYVSNDNVWLANPDGSGQYQVTLDGTASDPYREASEADDGTIVAVHGNGASAQVVRMSQNGTLLNTPFTTDVPDTGPLNAVVSPDDSKVAYWGAVGVNDCGYPYFCPGASRTYQVSYADHYVDPSTCNPQYAGWSSYGWPAWQAESIDTVRAVAAQASLQVERISEAISEPHTERGSAVGQPNARCWAPPRARAAPRRRTPCASGSSDDDRFTAGPRRGTPRYVEPRALGGAVTRWSLPDGCDSAGGGSAMGLAVGK